jgi:hypothetical protein
MAVAGQFNIFICKSVNIQLSLSIRDVFLTHLTRNLPPSLEHTVSYCSPVKVRQSYITPMEEQGVEEYSSYLFTTTALDGGQRSVSRPDRALPPGKGSPVPIRHLAGLAPEPVWTMPGIEHRSPGRPVCSQTLY